MKIQYGSIIKRKLNMEVKMKKTRENKKNNESLKSINSQRAITLIALVVTIVVLLILAGVSLNLVLGENGLINKAKEGRDKYAEATKNEQSELNKVDEWLEENIGGSTGGGGSQNLPSTGETKPYLPGDDFHQVPGTDLDNGLVIEDGIGNQYVWIEVPKKAEVYPTAGLDITNFTEEEYTKIENDLHTYTDYYRRNTSGTLTKYTDTYYVDTDNTGWFASATEYNTLKQKMLKSVYQNGGFWIGRYEAGIDTNRTAEGEATIIPVSKADKYPYTYVTRTQAHVLAQKVNSGNYTSSLMFGVQWDLVMKFLETKGVSQADLRSDSTIWGNYSNNTYNIDQENAKQSSNSGIDWVDAENKTTSGAILLTTGASEEFNKMNIYDLAGNVYEWTLEYSSSTNVPCALRGGSYDDGGSFIPASGRGINGTTSSSSSSGFRLSLF